MRAGPVRCYGWPGPGPGCGRVAWADARRCTGVGKSQDGSVAISAALLPAWTGNRCRLGRVGRGWSAGAEAFPNRLTDLLSSITTVEDWCLELVPWPMGRGHPGSVVDRVHSVEMFHVKHGAGAGEIPSYAAHARSAARPRIGTASWPPVYATCAASNGPRPWE